MAVYRFSALSDGQSLAFNPSVDVLNFDQSVIAAADVRATIEGTNLRLSIASGTFAGKDILLLNIAPTRLTTGTSPSPMAAASSSATTAPRRPTTSLTGAYGNRRRERLTGRSV